MNDIPWTAAHRAQIDHIEAGMRDRGLAAHAPLVKGLVRPAIGLRTRLAEPTDLAVGATRFGGEPDLPPAFVWPVAPAEPVHFIAQVRLADVATCDVEGKLPRVGLLSVFAAATGTPVFAYLLPDAPDALARRPRPDDVAAELTSGDTTLVLRAAGAIVEPQVQLPSGITWPTDGPLTPREIDDRFYEIEAAVAAALFANSMPAAGDAPGSPAVHQMLGFGHPDLAYADVAEPEPIPPEMEILLAYDSDYLVGMEWGDAQRVYLLVDRAALAAGDFSKLRVAL